MTTPETMQSKKRHGDAFTGARQEGSQEGKLEQRTTGKEDKENAV